MPTALQYLKALSDPTRLRLLRVLARHELAVGEIVRLLEMGQSRVSRHLTILARTGMVRARRDGLWVYYRAASDGGWRAVLDAALALESADPEARPTMERDLRRAAEVVEERSATTRRFFDARAEEWDRLAREVLGDLDVPAMVAGLLDERAAHPPVAVDIGCGTGALLDVLAPRAGRAIGVDSSPRMLERARRRFEGRGGVELRLGEAEHLPLGDGEAQLAVLSMTLHHLAEPESGLREAARVTAEGGLLVVVELGRHDREDLRQAHGDRWLGFGGEELVAMASRAGFAAEKMKSIDLPRGLELGTYTLRRNGGKRNGQRKAVRGS